MHDLPDVTEHAAHVIREAHGVVAVWKPAGLATQAPPGIPSVEAWLRGRLHGNSTGGYLGVPHRLDRAVSGVVLFAATPRAARKLSRQFERREIRKAYLAIVSCDAADRDAVEAMTAGGVAWHDRVEKIADEARARVVPAGEPGGREAITMARIARRLSSDRLLLELSPVTGRMHQLRLQAAARGLPIVGDDLYGAARDALVAWDAWMKPTPQSTEQGTARNAPADDPRTRPIGLHARRITYSDPDTAAEVAIEAAVPWYWPDETR